MLDFFFGDFATWEHLSILIISAILIGINKTGIPGIGVFPVILLAMNFPIQLSTGLQLMLLCAADLIAVSYYRNKANWGLLVKLLPCALVGIGAGSVVLRYFDDADLKVAIGVIILFMSLMHFVKQYCLKDGWVPTHWIFAFLAGLTAGFTTQVANAAGPVMAIYLLAMHLPKEEYMGTSVWYFMILNWIKLPIFIAEGRINATAFWADLPMIPFLFLGAVIGIIFIRKAPQKIFENIIQILVVISAVKLLIS